MTKNNVVEIRLANLAIVLAIMFSIFGFNPAMAAKNRYIALEKVVIKNPDLDLFINEKSQTIDLARTQNIRVRVKAKDLYNSIDRTASFKISIFENNGTTRKFLSSQQLSVFKGFKRSRVLSISAGDFTSPTKNIEFDIYDTAGNVINTYKTTISAINIESQVSGSTGINIAEAECDGETFGECQIDYLLQRVQFEAKPQRQASTRVVKTNDGLYKITFPFPRNQFKFLGRKVRRKTKDNFETGPGDGTGAGVNDFGETLNISTINIGDSLSESQFITYGANGELIFNDNLFLDLEGKLGVGVNPPLAWLHVRNGDALYPSVKIGQGPLTTLPVDGAIEYDGTNLYFTVGSTRNILGAGGGSNGAVINNNLTQVFNQGAVTYNDTLITNNNVTQIFNQGNILFNQTTLDYFDTVNNYYNSITNYFNQTILHNNSYITYDNGTVIEFANGSYMQNAVLNGFTLFTNNSYTQINGSLAIPGGTHYQVLTYVNGLALWRDSSATFNGVTSVNQTFNIDNGTYNIDNGTYIYNNTVVTVNNGTYNFFNTDVLVNNGTYVYNNTDITVNNGTYNFFNTDVLVNNGTYVYNDTDITVNNGTYNFFNTDVLVNNGTYVYNDTFVTINNGYYDYTDTYISYTNGTTIYKNGDITYDNGTVITFKNGSYMQDAYLNGTTTIDGTLKIPGGSHYEVLTYINGDAIWRAPTGNGGTYVYNNGTEIYFNQNITFVDNVHNYFDTTINTTNNIEIHNNLDVSYIDVFEQYFNGVSNYYNQTVLYQNSEITLNNTDLLFTNGSRLIIPGGTNGQVLTLVNGEAIWRNTSAVVNGGTTTYNNGTTNYFNQDISYIDNIHNYFNTTILSYNGTSNYFNLDLTYVDIFEQYFNGDTYYFNQNITFVDNVHNYFDTTINTTNNIEIHNNLDVSYIDVFEQYFNGVSNYYNQTVLYQNSEITLNNTDLLFTNGSRLIIPGGTNGQVLTLVNGEAIWRNTTATVNTFNGTVTHTNGDTTYENGLVSFTNGDTIFRNGDVTFQNTTITLNGSVIKFNNGSYLQDPVFNGLAFFTDNSFTRINGTLQITGGNLGDVLTSDSNGVATWQATTGQWTDIGNVLHPADLAGQESVVIGGTSIATADIQLNANGGAIFNKQNGTDDFVVENAAGQAFTIEGANGNVSIATAGLITERTLELSDTTQSVTFSMLPSGATNGPMFIASLFGLTVNGSSSFTVNVDGASRELYINGDTVSVGAATGTATLNVDGSFALISNGGVQLVTAAGGITADYSYVKIAGNAGAVTLTAIPQITVTGTLQDGQIVILKGTNDINTVTVIHGNGVTLESGVDFTLGNKDILQLIYDTADSEWVEITRSDN